MGVFDPDTAVQSWIKIFTGIANAIIWFFRNL